MWLHFKHIFKFRFKYIGFNHKWSNSQWFLFHLFDVMASCGFSIHLVLFRLNINMTNYNSVCQYYYTDWHVKIDDKIFWHFIFIYLFTVLKDKMESGKIGIGTLECYKVSDWKLAIKNSDQLISTYYQTNIENVKAFEKTMKIIVERLIFSI